ncbi:non-ribosomal peptide synthetase [Stella sp.]|uniref:non-ribosomal peptide synthetase n=1 Tax=Stella sp. TaxID=2912054 RepID=UPI0035B39FC8
MTATGERLRRIAGPEGDPPPAADLVAAIERIAREDPHRPAVVTPEGTTDFVTLAGLSRSLAAHIGPAGTAPVLVLGEAGLLLVVAIVACLRVGRAVVPLDATMTPLRVRQVALSSGADVLVRHDDEAPPVPELAPDRIRTVLAGTLDPAAESGPARRGKEAFLIFTSGSTGIPKGVCHGPEAMAAAVAMLDAIVDVRDGDRVALVTPATTLTGAVCSVAPLAVGATVLLLSDRASVHALIDLMEHHRATHLMSYVGLARAVAAHPRAAAGFRHLRHLLVYGDIVRAEDCRTLQWLLPPGGRIQMLYGASEAMMAAACVATPDIGGADGRTPLGWPLPDMEMWLRLLPADDRADAQADQPADEPGGDKFGELCLAGPRVTDGYYRDRGAGDAKFLPHPLDPGRRLFRTGDLVRPRPDGMLDFAGRLDNQVKLRGWRIELEEIETAALRVPGIAAAGVVARRGADGIVDQLVLHLAASGDAGAAPDAVARATSAALRASLPAPMVPAATVLHAALPLTATGKIDRLRLAELDRQDQDAAPRARPTAADGDWPDPRSARIAAVIAEECGLARLHPADDLNLLGVDSLQAVNTALRIEKLWGVAVEPLDLLSGRPVGDVVAGVIAAGRPA